MHFWTETNMQQQQTAQEKARRWLDQLAELVQPLVEPDYLKGDAPNGPVVRQVSDSRLNRDRELDSKHVPLLRAGRLRDKDRDRFGEVVQGQIAASDPRVVGRAFAMLFRYCGAITMHWRDTVAGCLFEYFMASPPELSAEEIGVVADHLRSDEARRWKCASGLDFQFIKELQELQADESALEELAEAFRGHKSRPDDDGRRLEFPERDARLRIASIAKSTPGYDLGLTAPYLAPIRGAEPALGELFQHCASAASPKPTVKWQKAAEGLLARVEFADLCDRFEQMVGELGGWHGGVAERDVDFLRGVVWLFGVAHDPACCPLLGQMLVASGYALHVGTRSVKVFGATLWALSKIPGERPLAEISRARSRFRKGLLNSMLTCALEKAAKERDVTLEDIEEIVVPTYCMETPGLRVEQFGDVEARFEVVGSTTIALRWFQGEREFRDVPEAAKKSSWQLSELKKAKKDAESTLRAQRRRLDGLFLHEREWPYGVWRDRLLDHPLLTNMMRRLIWEFRSSGASRLGIALDGVLCDIEGNALQELDDCKVALWHPLHARRETVQAWREFLVGREVRQPFRQAFREIYVPADAERLSRTGSNRFAAHVLRQKQLAAVAFERGWIYSNGDGPDSPYKSVDLQLGRLDVTACLAAHLPEVEDAEGRQELCQDYVVTDEVSFSGPSLDDVAVDEIPEIVFSEVMRDIGIFVSVASVGCDPTWGRKGAESFRGYWQSFAFGDLSATAATRKEVLELLIPRLKELSSARLEGRFLVVPGRLRTYKIHLGSGHVLMEPNDQHLCIVPNSPALSTSAGPLFVPFEGDPTLDLIMSKALLLAHDDEIRDTAIAKQIRRA
jgi:hypothetical protein